MRGWLRNAVGLACGLGGAVLWAYGLTVLQPLAEPAKPWHDAWASNNTYWARDVRWMALVVIFAALVVTFRGDRTRSAVAALGALAWLGVDLWLDRIDVTATVPVAIGAGAVVLAAWTAGLVAAPGVGTGPRRGVLLLAAVAAAALVPLAGGIESPTDTEPALTPTALAAGGLLAAVAIVAALAAAPARSAARTAAAVLVAGGAAAGLTFLRAAPPGGRFFVAVVAGAALLTGVAVLSTAWPDRTPMRIAYLALLFGGTTAYLVVMLLALLVVTAILVPVAATFTALAGNPPVNAADTDVLFVLIGLLAALPFGWLLIRVPAVQEAGPGGVSRPPAPGARTGAAA